MAVFRNRKFSAGETVVVDGNQYIDCELIGCTLVYGGGALPKFGGNGRVEGCMWKFEGPADATLRFLQALYLVDPGTGEQLIAIIKGQPTPGTRPPGKPS